LRAAAARPSDSVMSEPSSLRAAIKTPDTWWPTVFSGPAANRLVAWVADSDRVTPNRITGISLAVGVVDGALFAVGRYPWTVAAGLLLQLAFILDCADGQLSRLRRTSSLYGYYIDKIVDRLKVSAVFLGVAWGIERSTGDGLAWRLAIAYIVCHFVNDLYRDAYRNLESRVTDRPSIAAPVAPWLRPLSILDAPFVRFAFGDLYFLLTLAAVCDLVWPFLWFESVVGALQLLFRPIYIVGHFQRINGRYPWEVRAPGPLR
jgi:archaetidylinositol phosphate synthase